MARYAAFLRGVSPMNLRMPALQACLEAAGFGNVKTLLSSGNVVFTSRATAASTLERKIETALTECFGQTFVTIVRPAEALAAILDSDPYSAFRPSARAKRIVSFLRTPPNSRLKLPIEFEGARILCVRGTEIFSVYLPNPRGPAFMTLIEKTFGKEITTRTWDTVTKVAAAAKTIKSNKSNK
jgi:uncharacterized protein (DUF1697 family)